GFRNRHAITATMVGNCGAISVGAIAGSMSQYIGRRLTPIIFVFFSEVFIPLWILPSSFSGLAASTFWVQFGMQGAWGVIPIQLSEMSPLGFCATLPGRISAGKQMVRERKGELILAYATVQVILLGATATFVIFTTTTGPENHGSNFEQQQVAFKGGALADGEKHEGSGLQSGEIGKKFGGFLFHPL
ncbi:hypothetical protein V8E53_013285, partial [Lactarius tabidus]